MSASSGMVRSAGVRGMCCSTAGSSAVLAANAARQLRCRGGNGGKNAVFAAIAQDSVSVCQPQLGETDMHVPQPLLLAVTKE